MRAPITTFWGKLRAPSGEGAPAEWHPLTHHCADVAATTRALLERAVLRRWLGAHVGLPDLDPVQCDRLGFLAGLHDVGKVNIGFQNRRLARPPFTAGHVGPVLDLFGGPGPEGMRLAEALDLEPLQRWIDDEDGFFDLLLAVLAHHGRPLRPGSRYDPRLWRAADGLDPFAGAADLRREAARWFPCAFLEAPPLPAQPAFQHAFNGVLTLADWIGSDPRFFPFSDRLDEDRFAWARAHAEGVLRRLGLDPDAPRRSLGGEPPRFAAVSDHPPYEPQRRILELPVASSGSLTVLEAETGSGKTEAALARFLRLFHAGVVDGLYFALPTRTAAVQIHRRVTQAIARAFARSDSPPPVVLAVPGYLSVDDHVGQRLAPFDVLWAEDDRERWRDRGWAAESPKRYLAGAVVVGTVDQVLLSALAVPHSHLRAAGLARHLLVIDEVHASDAYMTHILEAVLARHVGGGGHALLLSATLGATARERLLAPGRGAPVPPVEDAEAVPYPLITHAAPPTGRTARIPLPPAADRRVRVQLAALAADPAAIAAAALDAARSGARVLVIRNTVRECIETQVALEAAALPSAAAEPGAGADARPPTAVALLRCAGVPAPHHARFAREDRLALDAVIEACFGRAAPPTACVAVATQTVQQSLDLDADLLFTDLCPLDVLLQRLGRLHRHRRPRPCGFEQPRVVVLVPPDRDLTRFVRADGRASGPHGLGTVYPDLRVLEATWRELERNPLLELPRMNRPLVEAATHPASLHGIAEELGGAWRTHDQWITGTLLAHVRIAGNHLARWDLRFPEALFPADGARIGTRLGAEDRIAEFSTPIPGPFGTAIRRLILPHHLVRGAAADAGPEDIEIADDVVTFRFGERSYRYDRLGLRAADTTTPGNEEDDD